MVRSAKLKLDRLGQSVIIPLVARQIPPQRIKDLLEAAARVFIRQGYRQTQMSDVASELGVAKGTLYLYVTSKAALFDAALRYAGGLITDPDSLELPIATPAPGSLRAQVRMAVASRVVPPALVEALEHQTLTDPAHELEQIVREMFATASTNRTAIKLMDRCSDHPELGSMLYEEGRFAQLDLLSRYLEARIRAGSLRQVPDARAAARFVIEAVATWAVHVHWDPAPQAIDPSDAEQTLLQFVIAGLSPQ